LEPVANAHTQANQGTDPACTLAESQALQSEITEAFLQVIAT